MHLVCFGISWVHYGFSSCVTGIFGYFGVFCEFWVGAFYVVEVGLVSGFLALVEVFVFFDWVC